MVRRLWCWTLACALGAGAAVAMAPELAVAAQKARDPAAAEALFLQGREALEAGDFEKACDKFAESQRLDPGAGTLMNLATCEEKLGRLASAWQHWQEALTHLPAGDERIEFAKGRLEALEPDVPWLTITLVAAPEGTVVLRDGVQLGPGSLGEALPIDPGAHVIAVRAPAHHERRYEITLAKAEREQIEVAPGTPKPEPRPVAGGEAAPSLPVLGYVLGGVGVLGVGAGVVTGLMVADRQQTVDDNCSGSRCSQAGLDAASEGRTLLIANAVAWAVGVVGLGAGAYLVLSHDGSGAPTQRVGVASLPGGAALSLSGSFR